MIITVSKLNKQPTLFLQYKTGFATDSPTDFNAAKFMIAQMECFLKISRKLSKSRQSTL